MAAKEVMPLKMGVKGEPPATSEKEESAKSLSPKKTDSPLLERAKYCLEIRVTLSYPSVSHLPPKSTWIGPIIVEELRGVRVLTEAIVLGPGRAVLFYGCRSQGEGLDALEADQEAEHLEWIDHWVNHHACLEAFTLSVAARRQAASQAPRPWLLDWDHVISNPLMQHGGVEGNIDTRPEKGENKPKRQNPSKSKQRRGYQTSPWSNKKSNKSLYKSLNGDSQPDHWEEVTRWGHEQEKEYRKAINELKNNLRDSSPKPEESGDSLSESSRTSSGLTASSKSRDSLRSHRQGRRGARGSIRLPTFKDKGGPGTMKYDSWHFNVATYCRAGHHDQVLLPEVI